MSPHLSLGSEVFLELEVPLVEAEGRAFLEIHQQLDNNWVVVCIYQDVDLLSLISLSFLNRPLPCAAVGLLLSAP